MRAILLCLLATIAVAADLPYCRLTVTMGPGEDNKTVDGWWDEAHHLLFAEKEEAFMAPFPDDRIVKKEFARAGAAPRQPDYIAKRMVQLAKEDAEKADREKRAKGGKPATSDPQPHR